MWTAASSQQMTRYRQSLAVAAVVDKRPTNDALKAIARSLRRMLALCLQKKQVFRNHNLAISIYLYRPNGICVRSPPGNRNVKLTELIMAK